MSINECLWTLVNVNEKSERSETKFFSERS